MTRPSTSWRAAHDCAAICVYARHAGIAGMIDRTPHFRRRLIGI